MIFKGRTGVRYPYARWGYTRGGGRVWHGGIDLEGLDDDTIRMPGCNGKTITGTVTRARRVTNRQDLTWEWGWYVCVKLDDGQTPDRVNYLYFCHCERLLAQTGQRVKTGDALAVMGNTGNAALASPPYAHCHFEVRAFPGGRGLDPTAYAGVPNAVGTYGAKEGTDGGKPAPSDDKKEHAQAAQPARKESKTVQELKIKPKDADDAAEIARMAFALGLPQQYTASVGDAMTMWRTAKARGAEYSAREV